MSWSDLDAQLDDAVMDAFGESVVLHLASGDKPVSGAFSDEVIQADVPGGGYVSGVDAELELYRVDVVELRKGVELTVAGERWQVLAAPVAQGSKTSVVKLAKGGADGSAGRPDIRY